MKNSKLEEISSKMKDLDLCMMSTISDNGSIASRPMSNNGDVEYDGNSYFFTYHESNVSKDILKNKLVNLSFEGKDKLFISIEGKASLIKDKNILKEHWVDELNVWFKEGIDTPGIVMIHVEAQNLRYWHKMEMKEIKL